jgi:hypothetical protein
MALLSVVRDVCSVVGVLPPTAVFTNINANPTMQEMLATANEMAQRIAYDNREWTTLKLVNTITGDGATEGFPLPANYKRMLLTGNVWRSTTPSVPMRFIPDTDEWINRRMRNYSDNRGEWTIYGGLIHIQPILAATETASFTYLDKNAVALAAGGNGDSFLADGDTFRLNERLLKLGMIVEWKQHKGSPYAEDMGTYVDTLMAEQAADVPAPIIIGKMTISQAAAVTVAYPWPVPTP